MATLTGFLSTFGLTSMTAYAPRLVFIPSGPAVTGTKYLVASRSVTAVIDPATGAFSIDLLPNIATRPATHYRVRVEWLDPDVFGPGQGYTGRDSPDWQFIMPPEGGDIAALMDTPPTALEVHIGEEDDPRFGFWFQPSTSYLRS